MKAGNSLGLGTNLVRPCIYVYSQILLEVAQENQKLCWYWPWWVPSAATPGPGSHWLILNYAGCASCYCFPSRT